MSNACKGKASKQRYTKVMQQQVQQTLFWLTE
jgi:hypothetical protein